MRVDHIIELGDPLANDFGFTSELFEGYLWIKDNMITISLILSRYPSQGNFKTLVNTILNSGYSVRVPTPSAQMRAILKRWDFKPLDVYEMAVSEWVEYWVKNYHCAQ